MWIPPASRGTSIARLLSSVARPNPASQGKILTPSRASSKIERLKTGRAIPSPRNAYYDPRNRHHDDRGIVITIISECPSRSFRNRHYSAPESTHISRSPSNKGRQGCKSLAVSVVPKTWLLIGIPSLGSYALASSVSRSRAKIAERDQRVSSL